MDWTSSGARKGYLEISTEYPVPSKACCTLRSLPSLKRTFNRSPMDATDAIERPSRIGTFSRRFTSQREPAGRTARKADSLRYSPSANEASLMPTLEANESDEPERRLPLRHRLRTATPRIPERFGRNQSQALAGPQTDEGPGVPRCARRAHGPN